MSHYSAGATHNQQAPLYIPVVVSLQESLELNPVDIADIAKLPMSRPVKEMCYSHQSHFVINNGAVELSYESLRRACGRSHKELRVLNHNEVARLMHLKGLQQPNAFIPTRQGLVFNKDFASIFPSIPAYQLGKMAIAGKKKAGVIVDNTYFPTLADCASRFKVSAEVMYCLIKRHGYLLTSERFELRKHVSSQRKADRAGLIL